MEYVQQGARAMRDVKEMGAVLKSFDKGNVDMASVVKAATTVGGRVKEIGEEGAMRDVVPAGKAFGKQRLAAAVSAGSNGFEKLSKGDMQTKGREVVASGRDKVANAASAAKAVVSSNEGEGGGGGGGGGTTAGRLTAAASGGFEKLSATSSEQLHKFEKLSGVDVHQKVGQGKERLALAGTSAKLAAKQISADENVASKLEKVSGAANTGFEKFEKMSGLSKEDLQRQRNHAAAQGRETIAAAKHSIETTLANEDETATTRVSAAVSSGFEKLSNVSKGDVQARGVGALEHGRERLVAAAKAAQNTANQHTDDSEKSSDSVSFTQKLEKMLPVSKDGVQSKGRDAVAQGREKLAAAKNVMTLKPETDESTLNVTAQRVAALSSASFDRLEKVGKEKQGVVAQMASKARGLQETLNNTFNKSHNRPLTDEEQQEEQRAEREAAEALRGGSEAPPALYTPGRMPLSGYSSSLADGDSRDGDFGSGESPQEASTSHPKGVMEGWEKFGIQHYILTGF